MDSLSGFNVFGLNTSGNSSSSPESIADDSIDNFSVSLDLDNNMEEEEEELQRFEVVEDEGRVDGNGVNGNGLEEGNEQGQEMDDAPNNLEEAPAPAVVEMVDAAQAEHEEQMLRFGSSSSNPHPLLVPNVIRDILKNLSLTEVMKCRTVCHQWNDEACRIIQKGKTITFTDNSGITSYLKYYPNPAEDGDLTRPIHLAYQMYKIEFCESNAVLQRFLVAHGTHIQTLILQQSLPICEKELYWALENHLPNLEVLWIRFVPIPRRLPTKAEKCDKCEGGVPLGLVHVHEHRFPTVKHFTIGTQSFVAREPGIPPAAVIPGEAPGGAGAGGGNGNVDEEDPEGEENYQIQNVPQRGEETAIRTSLARLLSSFPNLQTITCSTLDNWCDCFVSLGILRALVQVPAETLRCIVKLNFPLHVTQPVLEGINSLSLINLSELNIHFGRNVEVAAARKLFATVGPNLKYMSLSIPADYPYSRCIRLPGHDMRKLKNMRLSRYRWPMDFLENLTTLQTLTCIDMPIPTIFPVSIKHEHNLSVLKIHGRDFPVKDSEVVSRITRAFPRLRVLYIPGTNDDCLRVIYTDLPYLEELACTDGEFTDCGISGVSLEVCNDLAETMTYLFVNPDKFRRDLFIGNLTNLKHLRLESQLMTHLSVLFGIVKCSGIEYLQLKSDKLTDAAIESIADQMMGSLHTLNVVNCPLVTEAGKFFAKERIPAVKVYISGDMIEDPEQLERIKLQSKHANYDATSRRRARDRPQSPRDLHRRRMAFRFLHRDRNQELNEDPAAVAAALAALPQQGPAHPPPGGPYEHLYEMHLHDLNANEPLVGDGVEPADIHALLQRADLVPYPNFLADDDDISSSDGENEEMNYFAGLNG